LAGTRDALLDMPLRHTPHDVHSQAWGRELARVNGVLTRSVCLLCQVGGCTPCRCW
jgi:hypothetical protein